VPAKIGNEVKEHPPVVVDLNPGDLRTSKGGFIVAERNGSKEPAEFYVVESMRNGGNGFESPVPGSHLMNAAIGELFETTAMRGYIVNIASGGRIEDRMENYDRLIVAITDLDLAETQDGIITHVLMSPGEVQWIPRGAHHATANAAGSPAAFFTFEFN
jgi:hypothetical protein